MSRIFATPAERLLEKIVVSQSIVNTGLRQVTFRSIDINWEQLFSNAREIDIFVIYARTWRANNIHHLTEFVKREHHRLRVILPDPEDKLVLQQLSNLLNRPANELKRLIYEAQTEYLALRAISQKCSGAQVDIWFVSVAPVYTLYRFDDNVVLSLHEYTPKQLSGGVPHLVAVKDGLLYKFVVDEFETLIDPTSPRKITRKITQ